MLIDRKKFYENFPSAKLGKAKITEPRKVGFEAIFDAWDEIPHLDIREWLAYALATAWHETGKRMQPVREGFADTDAQAYACVAAYCQKKRTDNYARRHDNGMSYYGRGYVQLTHAANYVKMGQRLGLGKKLYDNPDLAMQPGTAAKILLIGMEEGCFRPKAGQLIDYFDGKKNDWKNARGLINGDIAKNGMTVGNYGKAFFTALDYK